MDFRGKYLPTVDWCEENIVVNKVILYVFLIIGHSILLDKMRQRSYSTQSGTC